MFSFVFVFFADLFCVRSIVLKASGDLWGSHASRYFDRNMLPTGLFGAILAKSFTPLSFVQLICGFPSEFFQESSYESYFVDCAISTIGDGNIDCLDLSDASFKDIDLVFVQNSSSCAVSVREVSNSIIHIFPLTCSLFIKGSFSLRINNSMSEYVNSTNRDGFPLPDWFIKLLSLKELCLSDLFYIKSFGTNRSYRFEESQVASSPIRFCASHAAMYDIGDTIPAPVVNREEGEMEAVELSVEESIVDTIPNYSF
ncbi:MAG: hypothetical protein GY861_21735 [bacterium]|nr:hypothetical protein [bacterium]